MSEVRFYTKSVRSMECACNTGGQPSDGAERRGANSMFKESAGAG